jgi:hypothetical protein
MPCVRTGDISPAGVALDRLWIRYGEHLAHPKTLDRFSGPRIFVRRVPIWKDRTIGAAYLEAPALCAGDVLVVKHAQDDPDVLVGLAAWLRTTEAAALMHARRPLLTMRSSYPKFAAKDLLAIVRDAPADDHLKLVSAMRSVA